MAQNMEISLEPSPVGRSVKHTVVFLVVSSGLLIGLEAKKHW